MAKRKRRRGERVMEQKDNRQKADPQNVGAEAVTEEAAAQNASGTPPDEAGQAEAQPQTAQPQTAQPQAAQPETKADESAKALEEAQAKRDEYLAMAQRVQADFDNFRRRNQNVRKEAFDDGARAFAKTLLPVMDNLERAIAAAVESPDTSLREGVEMVHRQFAEAFTKRGIAVIDRKGQPFDPNLEHAILQGTPEDGEPGTVCEVFQKGYTLDGVVLREAMVKVVPE